MTNTLMTTNEVLMSDVRTLIENAKSRVARVVNSEMTMLYWNIGKRIKDEILQDERAEYGEQVVKSLSTSLAAEYGKGFTYTAITRMIKFHDFFPEMQIVATVSQQLSWSHILDLLPIKDHMQRDFYAYMAIHEQWSVRELRSKINKMTYERTIGTQKSGDSAKQMMLLLKNENKLNLDSVLKDPLVLDFLQLPADYTENELEDAILKEIEKFILELGTGFSFVARQKRMTIDGDHFWLDLLFYHRRLKRLVAIELKLGKFKAEYKGQMELYLNWLKKYECFDGEETPIGIILCTEKSHAQVELLDMSSSGIHVAQYWTELPPIEVFERKVQEIVLRCKEIYEEKIENND